MTDKLTREQRSRLMSRVHGKDTLIEKKVRSYLHKCGFRFRKHVAGLPGSPDIVLPKYQAVVFVHGCFWHGHTDCRKSQLPTTNKFFWEEKRQANIERDERKVRELIKLGWRVVVVWQCALETAQKKTLNLLKLRYWILSSNTKSEIP
jgi:DNA mismatch endonuclease, patch repair protein